jgi:putative transposase
MAGKERLKMVDKKDSNLSVNRQLKLLAVPKSSYYYKPLKFPKDCYLKDDIHEIYGKCPFYGYRRIHLETKALGWKAGERKIRSLMKELGIEAIYPKKKIRTTIPDKTHRKFPYLLRDIIIERPNQAWVSDITYTAVGGARAYVVAISDVFSRKVLSWRTSNTMDASFCLEALEEAIIRHGVPEIFNTDQGSQFTSQRFIGELEKRSIEISMTGKGRALDNIFAERLWRSLKYEDLYLNHYETLPELRKGVNRYFLFYNSQRRHQGIAYEIPNKRYAQGLMSKTA